MTKAEQETLIRWDEEERVAWLETTYPPMAAEWTRKGYPVVVAGTVDGVAQRWRAKVPPAAITFRRMIDGELPKQKANAGAFKSKSSVAGAARDKTEKNGTVVQSENDFENGDSDA